MTSICLPIRFSTNNTADHSFRITNVFELIATWLPIIFSRTLIFISWFEIIFCSSACIHTIWRIRVCTSSKVSSFLIDTDTQLRIWVILNIFRFWMKAVHKMTTGFPINFKELFLWVYSMNFCQIEILSIVFFITTILTIDPTNVNLTNVEMIVSLTVITFTIYLVTWILVNPIKTIALRLGYLPIIFSHCCVIHDKIILNLERYLCIILSQI